MTPSNNQNSVESQHVVDPLQGLFESGRATDLIRAYYRENDSGTKIYSGALFDVAALSSDWNPNAISESDLLSLSLLSVPVKGNLVRDLRSGFFGEPLPSSGKSLNQLLAEIPADVRFEDLSTDELFDLHLGKGKPAHDLWDALRKCSKDRGWSFGPTRTSKLLALKRPLLVPIYDDVVAEVFKRDGSKHHWHDMRALVGAPNVVENIEKSLDDLAGQTPKLSVIRALDVILWMEQKGNYALGANGSLY